MIVLLLFLLACNPDEGSAPPDDSAGDSTADSTADSTHDSFVDTAADDAFLLRADEHVALDFAYQGETVPDGVLQIRAVGGLGSSSELEWEVTGDFAVTGSHEPLEAGERRSLTVSFAPNNDQPALASGRVLLSADGQELSCTLAAVVGVADLPLATWTDDEWGSRTIVPLPSAPFPHPSASYDDSSVLIFVPSTFSDEGDMQVVTHIHGHGAMLEDMVADKYLLEQLTASGRDTVLIVPQGPEDASDGNFGWLDEPFGHQNLVSDVMGVLYRDGLTERPLPSRNAVTTHSGGYLCASYILEQGGIPIDVVHLFDALYGRDEVFEEFVLRGGIFRSVYTSSGGTDDNNQALRSSLRSAGVTVSDSFTDADLAASDVTIAHTSASHSGCVTEQRAYARWLAHSLMRRSPAAPPELLTSTVQAGQATVSWREDRGLVEDATYLVEGSQDGDSWQVLAETDGTTGTVDPEAQLAVFASHEGYGESAPSDIYGATGSTWLVVDGFDRILGGSWSSTTHDFAARLGLALGAEFGVAANEAVQEGIVSPGQASCVLWFLGDESTSDVTFSDDEQAWITDHLSGGGKLIVTGSELGYATDAGWLEDTLHTRYVSDDAGCTEAGGHDFGGVYTEDYPDVLSGETVIWEYDTGGAAAVGWNRQVISVGFAMETMDDETLTSAMAELVGWLGGC